MRCCTVLVSSRSSFRTAEARARSANPPAPASQGREANLSRPLRTWDAVVYITWMSTFFTIGHSTRPLAVFADLLQAAKAELVADVRTVPRSRTNPQYNQDSLPLALKAYQIGYRHFPALGGLRPKARSVPPGTNAFWRHASFHNYADYAMSDAFRAGLAELRESRRHAMLHH